MSLGVECLLPGDLATISRLILKVCYGRIEEAGYGHRFRITDSVIKPPRVGLGKFQVVCCAPDPFFRMLRAVVQVVPHGDLGA